MNVTLPEQLYPTGVISFGPVAVPNGIRGCEVLIASQTSVTPTIWPDADRRITFSLDCSYDGGQSYQVGQFSWAQGGGVFLNKVGSEIPFRRVTFDVHPVQPTHVKGFVQISGGPIRTSVTFTTL